MRIALTALTPGGPADVIVSGDDGATAGQVAEALAEAFAPKEHLAPVIMHPRAAAAGARLAARGPVLWAGGQQVAPETPAARALRDGAVVTTLEGASAATSLAEPGGVAELRVIGGPDAGTVHRLGPGVTTIGSGPGCQVRLQSPGVPAHAATVTVAWGLNVPSLDPAGPQLTLDGKPVGEACAWPFGGVLRVSTAVLQLMRPEAPDAHLSPAGHGLAYHRPPRFRPDMQPVKIGVPAEPKKGHGNGTALLISAAVPMIMGGVMVFITRQWLYSLFMLMTPVMVLGNWLGGSKQRGGSHRRKLRAYTAELAEAETKLEQAKAADEKRRREDAMDPAQVLLTATGPRRRLWERRADDPDTLRMRVGLFDGPAMIQLVPAAKDASGSKLPAVPVAFCVPVSMSLARLGVVGLAGPVDASRALARWMVAQAAVLHSPRDLSIVVLAADPAVGPHWNWVRWLPHCAPRGGEDCVALVGADLDSAAKRVTELVAEVSARLARVPPGQDGGSGFGSGPGASAEPVASSDLGPKILIVLDGARQLRRIPGMPQLLANARKTGVYAVCIDESARVLPEECAAVLSWDIPGQGNGNQHGVRVGPGGWSVASHGAAPSPVRPFLIRGHGGPFGQGGPAMLADQVSVGWADRVARALAPVLDVSRDDADSAIPDSARLLDLIHMPDPHPDLVLMAWQKRGRTTKIPIGVSADGPFILDLSADGPHGLIAGTTGAGKSELLQTIIAVLCVANRPDAMTFVLIDYKGGSAFKDCARLPHTVGMVSDLDGHLTVRALDSLGAELKRREEMLLHSGAKDIEDYWDTKRLRPELDLEPMPRLVLIIDEFAAMVAELPDFVDGLIDIARRGRSLGVHLILATQRPAGVVSADIRANTNLRIALRVTSSRRVGRRHRRARLRPHREIHPRALLRPIGRVQPGRGPVGSHRRPPARQRAGHRQRPDRPGPLAEPRPGDARPGQGARVRRRDDGDRPVGAGRRDRRRQRQGRPRPAAPAVAGAAAGARHAGRAARRGRGRAGRHPADPLRAHRPAAPAGPGAAHPGLPVRRAHGGGRRGPDRAVQPAAHAGRRGGRPRLARRRAHLRDRLRGGRAAAGERAPALRRRGGPGAGRPGGAAAEQAPQRDRAAPAAARRAGVRRAGRAAGRDLGRGPAAVDAPAARLVGGVLRRVRRVRHGPPGRDPAPGAPRGQRGRAARRRHHRPGGDARADRHRVRPPDDLPADRPQRQLVRRDQGAGAARAPARRAAHVQRQAEPAGGPGRAARPRSDRARAGGRAAADRRAGARAVRQAAAGSTGRCGSTRSRRGSRWPRPTGSTRTSSRRRGCGRWPAPAGTNCRRRASTWPRKGPASWWPARRGAGGRPR